MTDEDVPGTVITFYSYKGGTGRTMAVANVGCLLARASVRHAKVLLVDWDLEAPGLHRYFPRPGTPAASPQRGLIHMMRDIHARLTRELTGLRPEGVDASLEAFREQVIAAAVRDLDLSQYVRPTAEAGLFLMEAGSGDPQYGTLVNALDWEALYLEAPTVFGHLADRLARDYRYTLVDSRTGITDTSGICTTLLPEKLVIVFTPNAQSLEGVTHLARRAVMHRRASNDIRPLVIYPLPSRVEMQAPDEASNWRYGNGKEITGWQKPFESLVGELYGVERPSLEEYFNEVQVSHVPYYAFGERIATRLERGGTVSSMKASYERFVDRLVADGPWEKAITRSAPRSSPVELAAPRRGVKSTWLAFSGIAAAAVLLIAYYLATRPPSIETMLAELRAPSSAVSAATRASYVRQIYASGGRNFEDVRLAGVDLSDATLSQARFDRALLTGAKLDRAVLDSVSFEGALLDSASLAGARLTETRLTGASVRGASLAGANLTRAILPEGGLDSTNLTTAATILPDGSAGPWRADEDITLLAQPGAVVDTSGYVWIGNYDRAAGTGWSRPRLADLSHASLTEDPEAMQIGSRYFVDGSLILREALPKNDANYFRSVVSLGGLTRGSQVEVVQGPLRVARATATQYWAGVRVTCDARSEDCTVPRFQVQILAENTDSTLVTALRRVGHTVRRGRPNELVDRPTLRCYSESDCTAMETYLLPLVRNHVAGVELVRRTGGAPRGTARLYLPQPFRPAAR